MIHIIKQNLFQGMNINLKIECCLTTFNVIYIDIQISPFYLYALGFKKFYNPKIYVIFDKIFS